MRATLTAGALRKLLAPAAAMVGKKNVIPELNFARLEMSNRVLSLAITDLDGFAVLKTAAAGQDGVVLAPARALFKIIKATPADVYVTLTAGDHRLLVELKDARFSLIALPTSDFASEAWHTVETNSSRRFMVPACWIQQRLGIVATFVSTEETRYYLNGVCMHAFDGGLALVATDGHRLARNVSDIDVAGALGNSRIIVPSFAVNFLVKHCPKSEAFISLQTMPNNDNARFLEVQAGNLTYRCRLIDGTYPDYERVIPKGDVTMALTVSAAKLNATLARLTLAKTITLAMRGSHLVAAANDLDVGSSVIAVPGLSVRVGDFAEISVNRDYLRSICVAAGAQELAISFRGSNEPIDAKPTGGRDLFIQMPMRAPLGEILELPATAIAA